MLMNRRQIRRFIFVAFIAFLIWTGTTVYSIASYGNASYEQPADGIVVLGAGVFGDQPSPVFQERINHAIDLFEQGYAPLIIFTGGRGNKQQMAESEVAKAYAQNQGIPSNKILIETQSRTTEQNLYFAKQLADEWGIEAVIIVSDPLHMKRAMIIADDVGLVGYSSPTPSTRYKSWRTRSYFLIRETHYYQRYVVRRWFYQFSS